MITAKKKQLVWTTIRMVTKLTYELSVDQLIPLCLARLENVMTPYLQNVPALELKSALEQALLSGGKHLRPLLTYATGSVFSATWENLDVPAAAVELVHTYSLIHHDLPCMGNTHLRRGASPCHQVYGQGMAVLAGDGLQALAMQILATHTATIKPERRLQMAAVLSKACGPFGMVAGQAYAISLVNDAVISKDLLANMYRLKTGALFSASIEMGRLASKDDDDMNQQALKNFGDCLGFAFQIQDDIFNLEMNTANANKATYPKLYGLIAAKEKVESLYEDALQAINYMGHQAQLLRELAGHILQRK